MLEEGHRRRERGTDVVIGFVECHGRRNTEALVAGLEVVPRQALYYRGATFTEMDVDAVLARRPQVALVDEMAHTNVPGSRNAKRWQDIQQLLDSQTDAWGIKVSNVEIKHVDIDESMVRAIARQAEAERERRAKVIHAEGELQASEKLLAAAEILAAKPQAMQLRYLQTLTSIAGDKSSTIVFPVPGELMNALMRGTKTGE